MFFYKIKDKIVYEFLIMRNFIRVYLFLIILNY